MRCTSCSSTARRPAARIASATCGGRRSWTLRPITSSGGVIRSSSESTLKPRYTPSVPIRKIGSGIAATSARAVVSLVAGRSSLSSVGGAVTRPL